MSVILVDYGAGNLASVKRALEECGASVWVSGSPDDIDKASHIVLPGVGSFADGMRHLQENGWVKPLRYAALEDRIPLLGICLGMQLLADMGEEGCETSGLGLIGGVVKKMQPDSTSERLPHVGWNEVHPQRDSGLFSEIPCAADFYFVHSYHYQVTDPETVLATTPYCGGFVSAVTSGSITGVQFHPEKSSRNGLKLLNNFLSFGVS